MDPVLLKPILLALIIGFMIGLQRALSAMHKKEPVIIGARTFAIIALTGVLTGWLDERVEHFALIGTASIALFLTLGYFFKVQRLKKMGITTYISAFVTFLLGLMIWYGLQNYAIFIAAILIAILEIKPQLRSIESHISPTDIDAIVLLLVMSFVILPILPDKMIGPYHLFNPYKTWLMAIIIASISFIGYLGIRLLGHKYGIFITGAAGGLISSTAVTISLSQLYAKTKTLLNAYAGGIAIACTFMYARVFAEAFVVDPSFGLKLLIPFGLAFGGGLFYSLYHFLKSSSTDIELKSETLAKNPLQLSEAIKFALLFGIIYGAIAFVENRYGDIGVYIVSFLSGITDVDAITLSLAQMAKEASLHPHTAIEGIVIASVTNSLVKLLLAFWIGGKRLGVELTKFFALTLALLLAGLYGVTSFSITLG